MAVSAVGGVTPYYEGGIADATPAGHQGRDPAQWGRPQDQSAGQAAPAAPTPVAIPGAEFAQHGTFGIAIDPAPGAGRITGVPVTGYLGPADPRWQDWQEDITQARSAGTDDEPWYTEGRNIDDGHPDPYGRRLQVTDITDQHAANGTIVPARGIFRARELVVRNVAKLLLVPIIDYSERPMYPSIAIVAPQTTQPDPYLLEGTGRYVGSPANTYATTGLAQLQDPGVASAYESPAEPAYLPDTQESAAVPATGLDWLSYG